MLLLASLVCVYHMWGSPLQAERTNPELYTYTSVVQHTLLSITECHFVSCLSVLSIWHWMRFNVILSYTVGNDNDDDTCTHMSYLVICSKTDITLLPPWHTWYCTMKIIFAGEHSVQWFARKHASRFVRSEYVTYKKFICAIVEKKYTTILFQYAFEWFWDKSGISPGIFDTKWFNILRLLQYAFIHIYCDSII